MIRSMTGFGAADGRVGSHRVTVEVRTVNHRFFNPTVKLPGVLARWEHDVREALRQRVARGHVTLFARADRDEAQRPGAVIDEARLLAYVDQLRAFGARHELSFTPDLNALLRLPDVVTTVAVEEQPAEADGSSAELVALVTEATGAMTAMRDAEGARLRDVLLERVAVMEAAYVRIAERAPQRLVEQRDRLRAAVQELAEGVTLDEQRLAQEIAHLADRLDVSEEIDRFRSHVAEFRAALSPAEREPVGKRLGFLLQEMLREVNTTGSKANDAAMLRDVVVLKEELERVREQVENVE
jgi:uncharacterized protein (TIGR00255 family)